MTATEPNTTTKAPPEYLQAASVETLVEALYDNWGFSHFHTDGTYLFGSTVGKPREEFDYSGRCFPRSSVRAELLSRFAAMEAERDELKAGLGLIFQFVKKGKAELCMDLLREAIEKYEEAHGHDE